MSVRDKYAPGTDCRWEESEWPHRKFPWQMKQCTLLPDRIWIRFHLVFFGELTEEVTGWQSTDPNKV